MTDDIQDQENLRTMERITFRCPKGLIEEVEQWVEDGIFHNRSDALRAAIRREVDRRDDSNSHRRHR